MPDLFQTVYGRGLVPELKTFVHRPYLVVTMADLWDRFADQFDDGLVGPMLVTDLERDELDRQVAALPACASVIGLGGGQALDVAKYVAWTRRLPLFQVPTALSVNAAWGHRAAVRVDGVVRYIAFAVPEAVYVDFDVIRNAPLDLNRSGVGDILCYWTGHWDWKMAAESGRVEARWPYDPALVAEARVALDRVLDHAGEIGTMSDQGIRALAESLRWGGAAFHNAGWNPRHIEGAEHFVFYNLEYLTGKHFLHGQPVTLGVLLMSDLQENRPEEIRAIADRIGVRYRPEDMGVTWDDVAKALRTLPAFVEQAGLWYTVASARPIDRRLDRAHGGVAVELTGPRPARRLTDVATFADADALGQALATEIVAGIDAARSDRRPYVLGCPGGRSGRSTYQSLATLTQGADLGHVAIAMMDDYIELKPDGGWRQVPADAHFSCRRFATDEIVGPVNSGAVTPIPPASVWFPDPSDLPAYRRRLEDAGGVDLFIVASGASDGHVAFVRPGTPLDSDTSIIELAETTRRDNMATFPDFGSLDEVPTHGVSVGLGTIRDLSRSVRLVLLGSGKRTAARRVLAATDFEPDWPATFIHRCRDARILIDEAARPDGFTDGEEPT